MVHKLKKKKKKNKKKTMIASSSARSEQSSPRSDMNCQESPETDQRPIAFNGHLFPNSSDVGMEGTILLEKRRTTRVDNEEFKCTDTQLSSKLIGNKLWKFACLSSNWEDKLRFSIDAEKNISPNWFIQASLCVTAEDPAGISVEIVPWTDVEFRATHSTCQLDSDPEKLTTLIPLDNQPTVTVVLTFKLEMVITRSFGFRCHQKTTIDLTQKTSLSNMILQFESERLYVNSGYLGQLSEFFAAKTKHYKEGGESESPNDPSEDLPVVIMKCDIEHFKELMLIVYPSRKPIDVKNVEFIVPLADELSFLTVLADCETFMMSSAGGAMDVFIRFEWACRYHMADLQHHCLASMESSSDLAKLQKSPIYETLPYDVLKTLFERLVTVSNGYD